MKSLNYDRNIVQFYGACLRPGGDPLLVCEYMEGAAPSQVPIPTSNIVPVAVKVIVMLCCASPPTAQRMCGSHDTCRCQLLEEYKYKPRFIRCDSQVVISARRCRRTMTMSCSGTARDTSSRWTSRAAFTFCTRMTCAATLP